MLTEAETAAMKELLKSTTTGSYELKELLGEAWATVPDPTSYGQRFKASVEAGALPGVRGVGRGSDNHHRYEVRAAVTEL